MLPVGSNLSIFVTSAVPPVPIWFVLSIATAAIVQFLFTVNVPLYTVPCVAVGTVPSVVYLIVV